MMRHIYEVRKAERPVHWTVEVPGSKSITNRALLMAALTNDTVCLNGVLFSDDSRCFLQSLRSLGFCIEIREEKCQVIVHGCGGRIPVSKGEIYVGSAGTAARFLTAMLGVSDGIWRIQASPQMQRRPMRPLFEALLSLGAGIEWLGEIWHLPVCITGAGLNGKTDRGPARLQMDISVSTQFLSGFLLIAPMFANGLRIQITSEKKDGAYIRMTGRMMAEFGVTPAFCDGAYMIPAGSCYHRENYQIEPDISAACYFYAAAAITGGDALVRHVHRGGMQGDLKFLDVLEQMGCDVRDEPDGIRVTGPERGSPDRMQTMERGNGESDGSLPAGLHGIDVDMNDFSDQALTLAAIAPYADAPVQIKNIAHIRGQESDRIHAIVSNLDRAGIACEEYSDGVKIFPGQPRACRIETFDDHRVAMAFAVTGLRADGIVIENPACCRKTFEHYFDLLDELTGRNGIHE